MDHILRAMLNIICNILYPLHFYQPFHYQHMRANSPKSFYSLDFGVIAKHYPLIVYISLILMTCLHDSVFKL